MVKFNFYSAIYIARLLLEVVPCLCKVHEKCVFSMQKFHAVIFRECNLGKLFVWELQLLICLSTKNKRKMKVLCINSCAISEKLTSFTFLQLSVISLIYAGKGIVWFEFTFLSYYFQDDIQEFVYFVVWTWQTTSKRLSERKVAKFQKNIMKRGSVPETSSKKGFDYPVGPILLGFFVFVVIGSCMQSAYLSYFLAIFFSDFFYIEVCISYYCLLRYECVLCNIVTWSCIILQNMHVIILFWQLYVYKLFPVFFCPLAVSFYAPVMGCGYVLGLVTVKM